MGDDPMSGKTPFKQLLSHEEALTLITSNIKPIERTERIPLEDAFERVLAEEIVAELNVPPFDRSAMDGYAVKADDTFGASIFNPKSLQLIEVIHAGDIPNKIVGKNACTQIATGSPIPQGANAVVMLEFTKQNDSEIQILRPVYPGANISKKGEDIQKDESILTKNTYLTAAKVGVLAALGLSHVNVYECPRVAILPTGSEIRKVGSQLAPGQIFDINSHTLSAVAKQNGSTVTRHPIVSDTRAALKQAITSLLEHDIVIIAGGSSVGERDLLHGIVQDLGSILFHGVQVKPGKPTLFGMIQGTPIFGMPGYPTSCLSNAFLFLEPALRLKARKPIKKAASIEAQLAERIVSSSGRKQFLTVKIENNLAYPVYRHSGAITSMANADGYIILPINTDVVEKGDTVQVYLLDT
jgi:molybdenum cofactor synthesis domain-containing protein